MWLPRGITSSLFFLQTQAPEIHLQVFSVYVEDFFSSYAGAEISFIMLRSVNPALRPRLVHTHVQFLFLCNFGIHDAFRPGDLLRLLFRQRTDSGKITPRVCVCVCGVVGRITLTVSPACMLFTAVHPDYT